MDSTSNAVETKAANTLARFWRVYKVLTLAHLVANFASSGMLETNVKEISFEALVVFLREAPVIAATKILLRRVHHMSIAMYAGPISMHETVNVRVFLSMYMVVLRPTYVFEEFCPSATAVMDSGRLLLTCFGGIITSILDGSTFSNLDVNLRASFTELLFDYLTKFNAWKVPDMEKLIGRIRHALIAIYGAQLSLPVNEPEDSRLSVELRAQIERLRAKIVQIAGAESLAEFDATRATAVSTNTLVITPRLNNEYLAHQLFINPGYQMKLAGLNSPHGITRLYQGLHAAFWNSVTDDLRMQPTCFTRVIVVLAEIRDSLEAVGGDPVRIQGLIDIPLIEDGFRADALHWPDALIMVGGVVEIIKTMQAPARDAETNTKWLEVKQMMEAEDCDYPSVFCKALQFLFSTLGGMRVDVANTRLRAIAPVIMEHGVRYEQGKYEEKMYTDEAVKGWICLAIASECLDPMTLDSLKAGHAAAFIKVLRSGFYNLVLDWNPECVKPETFKMDDDRLLLLKIELDCLTCITSMLVGLAATTRQFLMVRVDQFDVQNQRMSAELGVVAQLVAEAIKDCSSTTITEIFSSILAFELSKTSMCFAEQVQIVADVTKFSDPAHDVYKIFKRRTLNFWTRSFEQVAIDPIAVQQLQMGAVIIPRIIKSAETSRIVFDKNLLVHGDRYNRHIIQAVSDM